MVGLRAAARFVFCAAARATCHFRSCTADAQVSAFNGGNALAAKAARMSSARISCKAARKNVIMMSATTDAILEQLKTLTVRARPFKLLFQLKLSR